MNTTPESRLLARSFPRKLRLTLPLPAPSEALERAGHIVRLELEGMREEGPGPIMGAGPLFCPWVRPARGIRPGQRQGCIGLSSLASNLVRESSWPAGVPYRGLRLFCCYDSGVISQGRASFPFPGTQGPTLCYDGRVSLSGPGTRSAVISNTSGPFILPKRQPGRDGRVSSSLGAGGNGGRHTSGPLL